MNLSEAFKAAVQKYYEGYDYEHSTKIGGTGKDFEFHFRKLDELQKETKAKPKRVKKEKSDLEMQGPDDNEENEPFPDDEEEEL